MKRICLYVFIITGFISTLDVNAKIWRVNNNPGKSCNYTTLTAAMHALKKGVINDGDTIHIEGSVTEYGKDGQTATNCDTVYRKVVIIGPGYFLSENTETQHNKESAKVRTLHIAKAAAETIIAGLEQVAPTAGTAYFSAAKTGLLPLYIGNPGLTTNNWSTQPQCFKLRIEANNVTVTHCRLYYVDLFNKTEALNNITITKCMFNPGLICAAAGDQAITNLVISNNFFRNDWYYGYSYWYQLTNSNMVIDLRGATGYNNYVNAQDAQWNAATFPVITPTIQNNTFYNGFSILAKGCQLYNNVFFPNLSSDYRAFGLWQYADRPHVARNNIIYNGRYWTSPSAGSLPYNNTNYGGMLNDGVNFYNNTTETTWFNSSTTKPFEDQSFKLASNSPARDNTTPTNEVKQRGMYGGLAPYVLSGLYTIPAVWEITIPNYPTGEVPSTGFEVNVKVKSH